MTEQKRLFFETEEGDQYVDLAAALTTVNRKQYHQMKRDGSPMCYSFTISSEGVDNVKPGQCSVLAPNWTTRNAAKMAAVGWKKQLKHAGVRIKDLPTYGKRCRVAMEPSATTELTLASGKKVQGLINHYIPQNSAAGSLFVSYIDTAGDTITYDNANTIVTVAITDDAGVTTDQNLVMTSGGAGDFDIIDEYLGSRRQQDTLEEDTPGPSSSNKMTSLFSTAEEMSDDIIEAVEDYADNRPYNLTGAGDLHLVGSFGHITYAPALTVSPLQDPRSVSGIAPLGLLKVKDFPEGSKFTVEVHAIYEM